MSLIPEKPLIFYPQLAAALGLEEAVMVQALKEFIDLGEPEAQGGFLWIELSGDKLLQLFPFWLEHDIQRITTRLREQGILLIASTSFRQGERFRYAINEQYRPASHTQPAIRAAQPAPTGRTQNRAQPIPQQWHPERDVLAQLAQYGIPEDFALEQVGEFVTYWSERNEPRYSWGSRYLKHVLRLWRNQETHVARKSQEVVMQESWQPSMDAFDILTVQAGINRNFVEDSIPEFILYYKELGTRSSTWNSRFVQHIKRQWARYTHTLQMDTEPRPISDNWQPDETVYDILAMANIDRQFAQNLVTEFIMYWKDSGHLVNSWNTKFLQYTKKQWASTHNHLNNPAAASGTNTMTHSHGSQQRSHQPSSTRHRNLAEELSDRSWAS